ncbi:hypothetical protein BC941DRAFT_464645 [Chlamydoabsidia padenii]|nr:hypothetical protein BC941DRAFT_464645 [Chlamydoabsidia padenii]
MATNHTRPKLQHRSSSSSLSSFHPNDPYKKSSKGRSQSLKPPSPDRRPSSPVMSSVPRLSIADRFMSGYQHSPLTSSPLSNVSSPIVTENKVSSTTTDSNPARATIHAIRPNPSRLTIADAFMKSSSSLLSSTSTTSSCLKQKESSTTTGIIHPLDNLSAPTNDSLDLNLELPSRSPSLYRNNHYSRPFGSQDTLVNNELLAKHQVEKLEGDEKDNIYYQVSLNDYYQQDQEATGNEEDERHENDSDFSSTTRLGDEEHDMDLQQHKPNGKQQYDDEEKNQNGYWIGCCFLSCGRLSKQQKQQQQQQQQQRRCGRRWRVFGLFLTTLLLIILSSIFWPRTPLIRIEGASLLSPAKVTTTNQGAMVGNVQFESQWMVNFTVDNRQNWVLPTRLVQLHVIVKDVLTGNVIGKGLQNDHPESLVLDPRAISTVQLGISLDYQARDISDTTFASLKKACVPSSSPLAKRSLLAPRAEEDTLKNHDDGKSTNGNNNTTALIPATINTNTSNNNNNNTLATNTTTVSNNNTTRQITPSPPSYPQSAKEHESLSLLFWMTLHIWGLDFFGYRPTVLVTSATGGFVCPLA